MTTLDDFWPSQENIDDCIRTEAEVVDDAVLLAVHEPGVLVTRSANGAIERSATEADLLASLMRDANDGSAVVVAITGDSGVGKSHLVRWLHAQLQRHPRRDHLVIVLVPKTASLRQVVERILNPLKGEAYQKLLAELSQTVEHLRPGHAAAMLATALSLILEQKFSEGIDSLRLSGRENRGLRERLALTKALRDLIREPEVFDQWLIKPLERIVRQTIEGGSEQQSGGQRRFVPDDLDPPETFAPDGSRRTIQAALQQLSRNDGASRPLAAEILQEALDPALRDVFQFSRALGQRTIEEIVDGIRRQLLRDGKELVLLIEDFAALAGIQQPLLNLMIAESDHGGVRIRAPIRTALAVTDGFLPSRQTILTRAKQEWLIPNTAATPQAIIDRLTSLAGRYLNAARWGAAALREQFQQNQDGALDAWVRPFPTELTDDEHLKLTAFGASPQGYPLFPLSPIAIESIARRELSPGGELRFNPRAFINIVLRETLSQRPLFEAKTFPPANFKGAAPNAEVQIALRARGMTQSQRDRLAPVLDYWAGNPSSLSDPPRIERGVFQAFDLPWPFLGEKPIGPVGPGQGKDNDKDEDDDKEKPDPLPPPPRPKYLDTWAQGSIDQNSARRVRTLLADALKNRIDWSTFRLKARAIEAGHLWLPFASVGNPSNEPKFVVAAEAKPLDPVLLAGMAALERWIASGKSWNYAKSEEDYPIAQLLLDRIEAQAIAWHAVAAEKQACVALKVLHRQALMLRLTRSAEPRIPPLSDYFADVPNPPWTPEISDTRPAAMAAQAIARAEVALPAVRCVIAESVGCFQGDGKNLMAIDPRRTLSAWRQPLPESGAMLINAQLGISRTAADDVLSRIESLVKRFSNAVEPVLSKIRECLGDCESTNPAPPLLEQLEQARKAGLFSLISTGSYDEAKRAVEKLSSDEARQLIRQALSFNAPDPQLQIENRLLAWSALSMEQLVAVNDALVHLDKVLPDLERAAEAQLGNLGGGDLEAMISALQSDLEKIVKEQDQ